jgi:hypothetical protein
MVTLFDPLNLDNRVSLNRTVFADHRAVDRRARSRQGWDLLSSQALRRQIEARRNFLELDAVALQGKDLVRLLDESLSSQDSRVSHEAARLANRFGRCLAYLLMTLTKFGSGWPVPDSAYLEHWTTIRQVYVGGGVMRGSLGKRMHSLCRRTLDHEGFRGLKLELARHPQLLPLIGAARSVEAGERALVFDFGSTNVKRGIASYRDEALTELRLGAPAPTNGLPDRIAGTADLSQVKALADFVTGTIVAAWRDASASGPPLSRHVVVSIASYVHDGQPPNYDAGYASLRLLSNNAAGFLSDIVSKALDSQVRISLSHDGTTAARVFAGQPHTAVIMLGTWLGVGFAPDDASGLRPLARDFEVVT